MKRTGSAAKSSKSNGSSTKSKSQPQLVKVALCLRGDKESELVPRKLYRLLPDKDAASEGYVRVVDDSGDDYLYPADYFALVNVPTAVAKALMLMA